MDTGTVITGCTASAGGALYAVGGGCNLTLKSNSKIDNCSATLADSGGAIYLYNGSTVNLKDGAIITGCKAGNSLNSLKTSASCKINDSTTSESAYNYDITADDVYNRSKLSAS